MKTIISKPIKKILELFYEDHDKKIHLREICRKTNLNENTVSQILSRLVEENLLNYEKRSNLKEYFMINNRKSNIIFSLFDLEKFDKIPKIRKKAINLYLENLPEFPLIVVLFGSTAKENFNDNSDIDLFLVVNKKIDDQKAKDYSESQTGIQINSFQINLKDFELEIQLKRDKILQSAIKTGYPIENPELFYKKILK
jgi:predicted nucleotidyltransferase/predicted transcriptional regulator